MYASHKKFLIGVPFTVGFACKAVERNRDSIRSHRNYCAVSGDELYAVTESSTWKGYRFYIHIYHDSFKAAAAMEGRIFIQFIALLITTRLKLVMNEAGWFKNHDLKKVISEMKTVRSVSINGTRKNTQSNLRHFFSTPNFFVVVDTFKQ